MRPEACASCNLGELLTCPTATVNACIQGQQLCRTIGWLLCSARTVRVTCAPKPAVASQCFSRERTAKVKILRTTLKELSPMQ